MERVRTGPGGERGPGPGVLLGLPGARVGHPGAVCGDCAVDLMPILSNRFCLQTFPPGADLQGEGTGSLWSDPTAEVHTDTGEIHFYENKTIREQVCFVPSFRVFAYYTYLIDELCVRQCRNQSPHDGDGHRMRPQTLGCRSLANVLSEQLQRGVCATHHCRSWGGRGREQPPPQIPVLVRLMAQNNSTGRGNGKHGGGSSQFLTE